MKSFKEFMNEELVFQVYDNGIVEGNNYFYYVPKDDIFKKVSTFTPGKFLGRENGMSKAVELFRKKTGLGIVEGFVQGRVDEATNKAEKYLKRQEEQAEYRKGEIKKVLSKSPFPIIGLEEALSTITTTMMYGLNRDLYNAEGGVENDPEEFAYWDKKLNNSKKETIKAQENIKLFLAELENIKKMIDFNKDQGVSYYLKK